MTDATNADESMDDLSHATADENLTWEDVAEDESTTSLGAANLIGWRRERFKDEGRKVEDAHRKALELAINERASEHARRSSAELIEDLSIRWGLSWTAISELVGVSIPALRKWRKGGGISGDSHSRLARLAAFNEMLEENCAIGEPALWLDTPLLPDRFVTPRKLYGLGTVAQVGLLEFAGLHHSPEDLLTRLIPNWEQSYPVRRHDALLADDGTVSVVPHR
jgi:hypothetical protein